MRNTKYWVWLVMIFGTANRRLWEAMCLFGDAEEAFEELSSGRFDDKLSESEIRNIENITLEQAVTHIESCNKNGIGIVGYEDEEYPPQLRHIFNPPALLYYRGHISCLKGTRTVTSVGARRAGEYSTYACRRICGDLAKSGIVIVSGFAVGIDITSHLAAAEANRPTACVLGCGVDVDYPRGNIKYRETIIANGGVFVSEFPPGTPANSYNFPKRNRILAALSKAVIVFEASLKSGSLITAGLALEQGREVFCLPPGDIFSGSFSGNISLLRDGAEALYSYKDVLSCFKFGGAVEKEIRLEANSDSYTVSTFGIGELVRGRSSSKKKSTSNAKKVIDKIENNTFVRENSENETEKTADSSIQDSLTEFQKKIVEVISGKKLHADVIAQELETDAAELFSELTELEIMGVVKGLPGKLFELA